MTDENKSSETPDWNSLAKEALDLWQEHLSSYANDPAAKAELTKLVAPMNRMFAEWSSMVQNVAHAATPSATPSSADAPRGAEPSGSAQPSGGAAASADAAPADGSDDMGDLGDRVADLERQLAELEAKLAADLTNVSGKA